MYEGRKLLYDKNGRVANKSNVIKVGIFHYMNKFLPYLNTLGPCLAVIEEVYYVKGQVCTPVASERFDELKELLDEKQVDVMDVVVDPVKKENEELKARLDKLEKLMSSPPLETPSIPTYEDTPDLALNYSRTRKEDLIKMLKEKGIEVSEGANKATIVELLKNA